MRRVRLPTRLWQLVQRKLHLRRHQLVRRVVLDRPQRQNLPFQSSDNREQPPGPTGQAVPEIQHGIFEFAELSHNIYQREYFRQIGLPREADFEPQSHRESPSESFCGTTRTV